ncbi:hypothetical protein CEP52_010423 [Fusarium oligoseptatum]|uniref:Zn(2)-C6 fungal-type domain-containing protein n=1 Tax=Fusarium oligoseptatum TaxID=2604345 RepID=A0A428T897_9HYPO|nr:hypothetical protein CEP52_010423 [Fusarium oligoseptatum]
MDLASYARRRKACDFCVARKIKCDGLKPTCSNCRQYGVDCGMTAVTNTSRKRVPPPPEGSSSVPIRRDSNSSVETRLASIELRLDQIIAGNASYNQTRQTTTSSNQTNVHLTFQNFPEIRVYKASDMWNEASTLPCLGISPQLPFGEMTMNVSQLELPPLVEILPALDNFFNNYNRVIPLFDRASFMHMVIDFYSPSSKRTRVPWAAINIVLAISYRVIDDLSIDDPRLAQHISNVQSVTTELMAWSDDLLGLQVLLGMVILFQGTTNPQLAIVLIGSAIRLAQSMGLPSRNIDPNPPSDASLHRHRVFWIAYILDKDLCLRSKSPYTQFDAETDQELPEQHAPDGAGILTSDIDNIRFNYLRARAELAVIQGRIHNLLYGRTRHRLNEEQRAASLSRIELMLANWRDAIPTELLHSEGLFKRFSRMPVQLMMNMYNRYLECLYRIHGIFAFDEAWINRVRGYLSPEVIKLGEDGIDGKVDHSNMPPLPDKWIEDVQYCRLGLELSAFGHETEYSVWLHACCNLSGLIILLVNIIEFPHHLLVVSDWDLINRVRGMFEKMNAEASQEPFFLITVAQELDRRARGQMRRVAQYATEFQDEFIGSSSGWMDVDMMQYGDGDDDS